jgi:hypothetical protein
MRFFKTRVSIAVVLGVSLTGCSGADGDAARVDVYPVTGKVTMSGAPVAEAIVTFSPKEEQPVALGRTNSKGEFSLTTYDAEDGAAAGAYSVLVTKSVSAASAGPTGHEAYAKGGPAAAHSRAAVQQGASMLPEKYSSRDKTPLEATVKADGENAFDFKLSP